MYHVSIPWHSLCNKSGKKEIFFNVAKGLPMKTPFIQMQGSAALSMLLMLIVYVSAGATTPQPEVSPQQIQDLNNQISEIEKKQKTIIRHTKQTQDLKKINEAEKLGLSKTLKKLTPEGGRFEIQSDGVIKIIPNDVSIVKKLLDKPESPDSVSPASKSTPQENISTDSKEIIERLRKANNQGLSDLLNKLSTGGGQFELIENGGIKIIPNDATKSKELARTTSTASKLVKQKNLTGLDKSLRDKQEELTGLSKSLSDSKEELTGLNKSLGDKQEELTGLSKSLSDKQEQLTGLSKSLSDKQEKLTGLTTSLAGVGSSVGSWRKVKSLAKAWIKKKNKAGLYVGKIRNIRWLYLVSIVTDKGVMDTQLVIRASDGKTVAFTQNTFEIYN